MKKQFPGMVETCLLVCIKIRSSLVAEFSAISEHAEHIRSVEQCTQRSKQKVNIVGNAASLDLQLHQKGQAAILLSVWKSSN